MNTTLKLGNNHAVYLMNLSDDQRAGIIKRHDKSEEQAWIYVRSFIKPIKEEVLKRFIFRYVADPYTEENCLDSLLKAAVETKNARLVEAVSFVIENFCLGGHSHLGVCFAKRPDAFSTEFIAAVVKAQEGNFKRVLLDYARS